MTDKLLLLPTQIAPPSAPVAPPPATAAAAPSSTHSTTPPPLAPLAPPTTAAVSANPPILSAPSAIPTIHSAGPYVGANTVEPIPVSVPLNSTPAEQPVLPTKVQTTEEEEPYTIKCVCDFNGDDGSTIYCETCDTWQHIECYYPDNREEAIRPDFAHSCIDCNPRPIDKQKAIQRQRRKLNPVSAVTSATLATPETTDKKPKRPPAKSHKKKAKPPPSDIQVNGGHLQPSAQDHGKHASPQDHAHPPTKKAKNSHKASHSISSQAPKPSPSHTTARGHPQGQPPSPAVTPPDFPLDVDLYAPSSNFMAAYSDRQVPIVNNNTFTNLTVPDTIASWLRDPAKMREETESEPKDVFHELPGQIPAHKFAIERQTVAVPGGGAAHLRYLTTPAAIKKDLILLELNGRVSFQNEYCASLENRWEQLTFPLPFVFFHDMLPLCIDTRQEGSLARFVRRSCRPSARLETYLDPSSTAQYHFMLVSDRHISSKEQITIQWDFRLPTIVKARWLRLLGLDDDEGGRSAAETEPPTNDEFEQLGGFVSSVLSEYGGCACELGKECAFARFYRSWQGHGHGHGKAQAPSRPTAPKKRAVKSKQKAQAISPTSTGQATNSRAASEGRTNDAAENESKPAIKPPSREASMDAFGILTAPTEREKRKAAALIETVRRREEEPKPKKKRQRVSDGAPAPPSKPKATKKTPAANSSAAAKATSGARHYVDAATSRSKSGSPAGTTAPKGSKATKRTLAGEPKEATQPRPIIAAPRPVYVDSGMQTDPTEGDWFSPPAPTTPAPRRIVSLSKRLLQHRHHQRLGTSSIKRPVITVAQKPSTSSTTTAPTTAAPDSSAMDIDAPRTATHKPVTVVVPATASSSTASPSPVIPSITSVPAKSPSLPAGDTDMPDAPPSLSPTSTKPPVPEATEPTPTPSPPPSTSMAPSNKVKAAELRVQPPPVPAFGGSTSNTTTPLSATGSPFSATSPFPPGVNGVAHPSPQRKKLSLSDYTKSRMNKAAAAAAVGKPSSAAPESAKPTSIPEDPKIGHGQENNSPSRDKSKDAKVGPTPSAVPTTNGGL